MSHGSAAVQAAVDTGTRRRTLTIPSGNVASNLTDFVVRVDLSSITDPAWWAYVRSDGGNIRLKAGGTVIPFEVAWINRTAKTGLLFFKSSLLSASANVFTVEVVGGLTAIGAGGTNGRNAVWSDYSYVAIPSVDFVNGVALTSLVDRTGRASSVSVVAGSGAPTLTASGINFAATTGYVKISGVPSGTSFVQHCYGRPTLNNNTNSRAFMGYNAAAASTTVGVEMRANISSSNNYGITDGTNGNLNYSGYTTATGLNVFNSWSMLYDGTTVRRLYRNGASPTSSPGAITAKGSAFDQLLWGIEDTNPTDLFSGDLDYLYLRHTALSADWLAAQQASWFGSSFYAIT